jgi:hypothetical protein
MFKVTAIQNVQETSEIEDRNVQVSVDQNVQENAPDAEATQSKKLKASMFIPLFSSKVEIVDFNWSTRVLSQRRFNNFGRLENVGSNIKDLTEQEDFSYSI